MACKFSVRIRKANAKAIKVNQNFREDMSAFSVVTLVLFKTLA